MIDARFAAKVCTMFGTEEFIKGGFLRWRIWFLMRSTASYRTSATSHTAGLVNHDGRVIIAPSTIAYGSFPADEMKYGMERKRQRSAGDTTPIYDAMGAFDPFPTMGSRIQQGILPLVTIARGTTIPLGTCFVISHEGLLLTAKHVVAEAWANRERKQNADGSWKEATQLYAIVMTNEPHEREDGTYFGGLWPIDKVYFDARYDLAAGFLRRGTRNSRPYDFPAFTLNIDVPMLGARVLGVGYYQMIGGELRAGEDGKEAMPYTARTAHSEGTIIEVFPEGRDKGMLPFPCYRVDTRFDGGMSGGPVFNAKGNVCGIICSSSPPTVDDPRHVSYVSMLFPAMMLQLAASLDESSPRLITLYELAQKGIVAIDESIQNMRMTIIERDGTKHDGKR